MRAAIHIPTPSEAPNMSNTKAGKKIIVIAGVTWNQIIRAKSKTVDIKKSTKPEITLLIGTMILGKYTFEIRLVLATKLFPLSAIEAEKNCQGSIPQRTRSG
jgi:hypothetical protein